MQSPSPHDPCIVLATGKDAARRLRRWPMAHPCPPLRATRFNAAGRDEGTALGTNKGTTSDEELAVT